MTFNFYSSNTEVFLNPRMPGDERRHIESALRANSHFPGHIWLATSGTTGKIKIAALSKQGILCSAEAVNLHLESDSTDCWINVLPTFHVGGIGIFARSALSGARIINLYHEKFKWDPAVFAHIAERESATLSALVPAQVFDLVKKGVRAPLKLRAVIVGGGALDDSLYARASTLGWKLLPSFGMTECSSQVATASLNGGRDLKLLAHVEVHTINEGFIRIKSRSILSTYAFLEEGGFVYSDPKVDGWFLTEDRGEVVGSCLNFFGRGADFLKVGGESVSLAKVKEAFVEYKLRFGIDEETVLFGSKDDRLGEIVTICIEGKQSENIEQFLVAFNQNVMPFERIRKVCYLDTIPRSALGKPLIREINPPEHAIRNL